MKLFNLNCGKNKTGSAIVVVIAVLTVLSIIASYLMSGKTKRAYFTRYMSNEKRAEAIAEAALDMLTASIRADGAKKINSPDSPTFTQLSDLLKKSINVSGGFSDGSGKNKVLQGAYSEGDRLQIGPDQTAKIKSAIESMNTDTDSIGGFEIELYASVSHTELFGSEASEDEGTNNNIVGVNRQLQRQSLSPGTVSQFNPDNNSFRIPIIYPNQKIDGYSETINVALPAGNADVQIDVQKVMPGNGSEACLSFAIKLTKIKIPFVPKKYTEGIIKKINNVLKESVNTCEPARPPIDIEDMVKEFFNKDNKIRLDDFTIRDLKSKTMSTDSLNYPPDKGPKQINGQAIEKGGLLRLECRVVYTPDKGKVSGQTIEKNMTAELPFKVSDTQPIASEYTFFVENAKNKQINLEFPPEDAKENKGFLAIAKEFVLHNLPPSQTKSINADSYKKFAQIKNIKTYYKPNYGFVSADNPPGRVRINGPLMECATYMGALNNISFTELNAVVPNKTPDEHCLDDRLKVRITFALKKSAGEAKSYLNSSEINNYKINFPVLFPDDKPGQDFMHGQPLGGGCSGAFNTLARIFRGEGDVGVFNFPSLLYGTAHMEYPMGGKVEANMQPKVSEISIIFWPNFELTGFEKIMKIQEFFSNIADKVGNMFNKDKENEGANETEEGEDDEDEENEEDEESESQEDPDQELVDSKLEGLDLSDIGLEDNSEFYYKIDNVVKTVNKGEDLWYGMPQYENEPPECNYNVSQNDSFKPPFRYSTKQYMKKASEFFESIKEFKTKYNSASPEFHGVIFINAPEGTIELGPFNYKGRAVIVTNAVRVDLKGDIKPQKRGDMLNIIASKGFISNEHAAEGQTIRAALFSNEMPILTDVFIDGNLIIGALNSTDFNRTNLHNIYIRYNPAITSVKTEDAMSKERYFVSFADNYSSTWYEKKQ